LSNNKPGSIIEIRYYFMIKVLHLRSSNIFSGPEALILDILTFGDRNKLEPFLARINKLEFEENPQLVKAARALQVEAVLLRYKRRFGIGLLLKVSAFAKKHYIDIFHTHSYRDDLIAALVAGRTGARKIATVHGWIVKDHWQKSLDLRILRGFDAVIAVSQEIYEELAESGVASQRLHLIPNGVDFDTFRKRENSELRGRFGYSEGDFVIGMMSRVEPEKNIDLLVNIAARVLDLVPQARFLIVGDGTQLGYLEEEARNNGVSDRFDFTGFREDVNDLLQIMDVFCVPSSTEGLPRSLLEALACEKLVIASRVGGMPGAIKDGESGLLLPEPTEAHLLEAISSAWDMGRAARAEMGRRGRTFARERFDIVDMVKKTEEVYCEVAGVCR
jgi:glycosyltransferase involved in cell wall biosynthesis